MMEYHGRRLRLRLEGESHSPEMRVTIWGLPVGEPVDMETLLGLLARRRPGQSPLTTGRNEKDEPEFLSGARDGMLTGEPVVIRFANEDRRPEDYAAIRTIPRPGHADYPQYLQGGAIPSGGGALGGRMTLLLCAAGGLALGLLKKKNITVAGRLLSVGGVRDIPLPVWPPKELLEALAEKKTAGMERRTHPPDGGGDPGGQGGGGFPGRGDRMRGSGAARRVGESPV